MAEHLVAIAEAHSAKPVSDTSETVGYVVAVLTWVLSAGVYIAAKWAIAEMPPWTLCFWRVVIAFLVLLPLVLHHLPAMRDLIRQHWLQLFIIGGIGLALTQGIMYTSLEYTTAINAGLIFAMMPIFSMILAWLVLGEAMGRWQVIGSAIALCGMIVIVVKGSLAALLSFSPNPGEGIALVAALLFPVYSVLLKRAKFDLPRLPLLVILLSAATIVALPLMLFEHWNGEHANLDTRGYLALAYAAIPGGALMYLLFNWSVDVLGAYRTGTTMYLQTVFIAVLAYFLLGEEIEPYHIAGAAIIVVGVVLVLAIKPRAAFIPAK